MTQPMTPRTALLRPSLWLPMALLAILPFFFLHASDNPASPIRQFYSLGHVLFFAGLAYWLASLSNFSGRSFPRRALLVLAAVFLAGGLIELVQLFIGREASLKDMAVNLAGACVGLAMAASAAGGRIGPLARGLQVLALGAGMALLSGPMLTLWDMNQAAQQFPVLSNFETRLQGKRWTNGTITHDISRHGRASLRVHLDARETYPGTTLTHGFGDWKGYAALELSIHNPDPSPLRMIVSIRDLEHSQNRRKGMRDRFDRSFTIQPGWNDLRIPVEDIRTAPHGRTLDMGRLTSMVVFTMHLPQDRVISLDHVRLVP
ncbi:MAG: VanZ family protein [Thermodesulfobacteriota bacterium]